jgi:TetR/AcrR family tetracycline transcriptional repressor
MTTRAQKQRLPSVVPTLTRAQVIDAALALVDEEGLEALSMRHLGARLNVEAMSLYNHVRDKADLLDGLHAAVLGELQPSRAAAAGDWRALLTGMALALRDALAAHPNLVPVIASRPVRAPESQATIAGAQAALEASGFSPRDAERAIHAVGVFTLGHALSEAGGDPFRDGASPPRARLEEFRFGLNALVDGLAPHARRSSRR